MYGAENVVRVKIEDTLKFQCKRQGRDRYYRISFFSFLSFFISYMWYEGWLSLNDDMKNIPYIRHTTFGQGTTSSLIFLALLCANFFSTQGPHSLSPFTHFNKENPIMTLFIYTHLRSMLYSEIM